MLVCLYAYVWACECVCVRGGGTKPNFMHSTLLHMQLILIPDVKDHLSLGTLGGCPAEVRLWCRWSTGDSPSVPSEWVHVVFFPRLLRHDKSKSISCFYTCTRSASWLLFSPTWSAILISHCLSSLPCHLLCCAVLCWVNRLSAVPSKNIAFTLLHLLYPLNWVAW